MESHPARAANDVLGNKDPPFDCPTRVGSPKSHPHLRKLFLFASELPDQHQLQIVRLKVPWKTI